MGAEAGLGSCARRVDKSPPEAEIVSSEAVRDLDRFTGGRVCESGGESVREASSSFHDRVGGLPP